MIEWVQFRVIDIHHIEIFQRVFLEQANDHGAEDDDGVREDLY